MIISFLILGAFQLGFIKPPFVLSAEKNTNGTEPSAIIKGHIIIKFKDSVSQCAECIIHNKQPFKDATADRSSSLDSLNGKFQVSNITPLFRPTSRTPKSVSELKAQEKQNFDAVQKKFSKRTTRIESNNKENLPNMYHTYLLTVPDSQDIGAAVSEYRRDAHVEYAEPDYQGSLLTVPNDPYYSSTGSWGQTYSDMWALKKVQPDPNWWADDTANGNGIVVAVIDSGVDSTHEDLQNSMWVNSGEIPNDNIDNDGNQFTDDYQGWDFVDNNNHPTDYLGHGTLNAGIISATGNNAKGIIGIAPKSKIMNLKVVSFDNMPLPESRVAQAINYAALMGADVINLSIVASDSIAQSKHLSDAVKIANRGYGSILVAAVANGNESLLQLSPQWLPEVIKVAASDETDHRASFSNFGPTLDVSAPGTSIAPPPPAYAPERSILTLKSSACTTTAVCDLQLIVGGNYMRQSGTSVSAPFVAGAAAAILSKHPTGFSNEDVRQVLRISADDIESPGFDSKSGAGRINLQRALNTDSVIRVELYSPLDLTTIQNQTSIDIYGSVVGIGPNHHFASWQLYYAPQTTLINEEPVWLPIGNPATYQVGGGYLGTWNLTGLQKNTYMLKLEATSSDNPVKKYQYIMPYITLITTSGYTNLPLPISTAAQPDDQMSPKASGNRVVFKDDRFTGIPQLWLYDFATNTERQIASIAGGGQSYLGLDISGDKIIWEEFNPQIPNKLFLYDITQNQTVQIFSASRVTAPAEHTTLEPAIWDNRIAWRERASDNREYLYTCLYDPTAHTCPIQNIVYTHTQTDNFYTHHLTSVDVYKNYVTYKSLDADMSPGINKYDSNTQQRWIQIIDNDDMDFSPKISGSTMVWTDNSSLMYPLITFCTNLTTRPCNQIQTVPPVKNSQYAPQISGDRIVWENYNAALRQTSADVFMYQINDPIGTETALTSDPADQYDAAISAGRVFWQDFRNAASNGSDIYYADIGNRLPQIQTGNQTAYVGFNLTFTLAATDQDNDLLAFTSANLPSGATFNPATGIFSWTPGTNQKGTFQVTFTASDGRDLTSKIITITVPQSGGPTPTPSPAPRPTGDTNGDGYVDYSDLAVVLANYNNPTSSGSSAGDFNQDSLVNIIDYAIWETTYNPRPPVNPPIQGPVTLNPTEDSYVDATNPSANYGNGTELQVDGSPIKISYMKFDLTPYANNSIASAKLRLKITNASTHTQNIKPVQAAWTESTITYNNRPTLGATIASFPGGTVGTWREVDITSYIQSVLGTQSSLGIDSSGSNDLYFYSSENTGDKPELVLQ